VSEIHGCNDVGRLLPGHLQAFGARIIFYDLFATGDAGGAKSVSLTELLQTADIVSLNLHLSEETFHLIGAQQLALLKTSAVLVNTSHSGVIDQATLIAALRRCPLRVK